MSLSVRLDQDLEDRLQSLAVSTGRTKNYYIKEAIKQYLEDKEDYIKGLAVLEKNEPTIGLDELRSSLGLED